MSAPPQSPPRLQDPIIRPRRPMLRLGHDQLPTTQILRGQLDHTFRQAGLLRDLAQTRPHQPPARFAEAMMDVKPWNQWTLEGQATPGTEEIIATLEAVLNLNPRHPFANHLYIHALEASPHPERADVAAARLRHLQPGLAHNVHMPSHIDIRRGRWEQAILSNVNAITDDRRYRKTLGGKPAGFFPFYAAHNQHMLAYAALMTGQSALALKSIRQMLADLPPDFVKEGATLAEGFFALPLEVLVRFGRWDEVLAEPESYPDYMPFSRAFHHGARAIAFAAKGDPRSAREEQVIYRERVPLVSKETFLGNNPGQAILSLADHMIEGEILIADGALEQGLNELHLALAEEDALRYDEPPGWMIPLRHSIGANLMKAARFAEAEKIYRDDLARHPENGWSLFGLTNSLRAQGKEAGPEDAHFRKIWAKADVSITSSCLCRPGT